MRGQVGVIQLHRAVDDLANVLHERFIRLAIITSSFKPRDHAQGCSPVCYELLVKIDAIPVDEQMRLSGVLDLDAEASALAAILTKDGVHRFLPDDASRRGRIFEIDACLERQNDEFGCWCHDSRSGVKQ